MTERLARLVLSIPSDSACYIDYERAAQALTHEWLSAANVIGDDTTEHALFNDPSVVDAKTAARVAYVFGLALSEARLSDSVDGWDAADAAHIARLTSEAGYKPTDWEAHRLTAVTARS